MTQASSMVRGWPYRAGGYGSLIVDPPWRFEDALRRPLEEVYQDTMSDEEIVGLDVAGLAAQAAHLYLWVTEAHLEVGLRCLRRWGFVRKHCFIWIKTSSSLEPRIGGGHYGRQAHELALFAVRGRAPALVADIPTWFAAPRTEHSAKPANIHRIAERMSPGPRVELFARRRTRGWRCWGNEVAC